MVRPRARDGRRARGVSNRRRTMSLAGVSVLSAEVSQPASTIRGGARRLVDPRLRQLAHRLHDATEIATFNAEIWGLAHPLRSVGRMLIAIAK